MPLCLALDAAIVLGGVVRRVKQPLCLALDAAIVLGGVALGVFLLLIVAVLLGMVLVVVVMVLVVMVILAACSAGQQDLVDDVHDGAAHIHGSHHVARVARAFNGVPVDGEFALVCAGQGLVALALVHKLGHSVEIENGRQCHALRQVGDRVPGILGRRKRRDINVREPAVYLLEEGRGLRRQLWVVRHREHGVDKVRETRLRGQLADGGVASLGGVALGVFLILIVT